MGLIVRLLVSMLSALLFYLCGKFKVDPTEVPTTATGIGAALGALITFSVSQFLRWKDSKGLKTAETISPGITKDTEAAKKVEEVWADIAEEKRTNGTDLLSVLFFVGFALLFSACVMGCASTERKQIAQGYVTVTGASKLVAVNYMAGTLSYEHARDDLKMIQAAQDALDAWDEARLLGDQSITDKAAQAAHAALLKLSPECALLVKMSQLPPATSRPAATQPGG